jgi:uncharacterized protein (TIGR02996 family)
VTHADAFLLDILRAPEDPAPRLVFADWLDERGPTPVRHYHLPNWLRLAWVRNRPDGYGSHYYRGYRATSAASSVVMEITDWLQAPRQNLGGRLDHWGSTQVAGYLCFVNEPYSSEDVALAFLRPLADHLGCPRAFARRAAWAECGGGKPVSGLCRVLLFPPLPPPAG